MDGMAERLTCDELQQAAAILRDLLGLVEADELVMSGSAIARIQGAVMALDEVSR